jgi:hypothetical protein
VTTGLGEMEGDARGDGVGDESAIAAGSPHATSRTVSSNRATRPGKDR